MAPPKGATANKPVISWSISRYNLYSQCPFKFACDVVWKIPDDQPKGPALVRGNDIHELASAYLKGAKPRLPPELLRADSLLRRLKAKRKKEPEAVIVEDTWAFSKGWGMSRWDDWANCWLRVKIDVAERTGNEVEITDWKTGKYRTDNRQDYEEQLNLYGAATLNVLNAVPDIRVRARLFYLDVDAIYPVPGAEVVYTQADRLPLQKDWDKKVKKMFVDKTFAPRPNQFCYNCSRRKSAGGPCPL